MFDLISPLDIINQAHHSFGFINKWAQVTVATCGVAETVSHFVLDCKGSSEAVASLHKDSEKIKSFSNTFCGKDRW